MGRPLGRAILATALAGMVAACATGGGPTGSPAIPSPSPTISSVPSPTPAPSKAVGLSVIYDGRLAVDADRSLEVRCVGKGTPTILLEGGGITPSLDEYPR